MTPMKPPSARPGQNPLRTILCALCILIAPCVPASAQSVAGCTSEGYRVVSRRWDVALKINWELRQDCAHPDWPARAVPISPDKNANSALQDTPGPRSQISFAAQPLLVHAGDAVRLWMQNNTVRIETRGIAEQSARAGEHVIVQITRQTDDAGLTVQQVAGIVRGPE